MASRSAFMSAEKSKASGKSIEDASPAPARWPSAGGTMGSTMAITFAP